MNVGNCFLCGEPVEERQAAYRVTGWEAARSGGGANRIIGRERIIGIVAHRFCAEREAADRRRGIAPEQGALL